MKELKELGAKKELPEWTVPLLEAAGKMEDPTQGAETAAGKEMQVSKADMWSVKVELQSLVADGIDLDHALEEAI